MLIQKKNIEWSFFFIYVYKIINRTELLDQDYKNNNS